MHQLPKQFCLTGALLLVIGGVAGCTAATPPSNGSTHHRGTPKAQQTFQTKQTRGNVMPTQQLSMLTSPVFEANQKIPAKYTCDGQNLNPPLSISGVPSSASSLALIVDDPDAPRGTFTHWILWDIPVNTTSIAEGQTPTDAVAGLNDFHYPGYGGPCPPGGTHRYRFKLYALDRAINLPHGSNLSDLQNAMKGHVLAESILQGTYTRP